MVRMPDGKDVPYWNTFYQEVRYKRPDAMDLMEIADFFRTSSEACKYRAINLGIFRINDKTFVKGYYG